ncbi:MAG: hypothetical protein VB074_11140 [Proteiniphilum sp.]|uniref:hypothetical protein n=1 Tax=Proteiniphilum sp. TaxID=1926877 RepID=UPI002B1F107E|nr:hypothetical protein [Proteiniphilum sp.]MEA5128732.1 hypothetical protein [Proteiniphilum sp.]
MKKMRFLMPLGFVAMAAVFSVAVMLLWNALIPTIFGLAVINFWQALGLFVLARILFGGFGHRGMMGGTRGMRRDNPIHEKWMKMTDEQRKEFINRKREHMHRGHFFGGGFDFDGDSKKDNE